MEPADRKSHWRVCLHRRHSTMVGSEELKGIDNSVNIEKQLKQGIWDELPPRSVPSVSFSYIITCRLSFFLRNSDNALKNNRRNAELGTREELRRWAEKNSTAPTISIQYPQTAAPCSHGAYQDYIPMR